MYRHIQHTRLLNHLLQIRTPLAQEETTIKEVQLARHFEYMQGQHLAIVFFCQDAAEPPQPLRLIQISHRQQHRVIYRRQGFLVQHLFRTLLLFTLAEVSPIQHKPDCNPSHADKSYLIHLACQKYSHS